LRHQEEKKVDDGVPPKMMASGAPRAPVELDPSGQSESSESSRERHDEIHDEMWTTKNNNFSNYLYH
jgi:hypothetical protein